MSLDVEREREREKERECLCVCAREREKKVELERWVGKSCNNQIYQLAIHTLSRFDIDIGQRTIARTHTYSRQMKKKNK